MSSPPSPSPPPATPSKGKTKSLFNASSTPDDTPDGAAQSQPASAAASPAPEAGSSSSTAANGASASTSTSAIPPSISASASASPAAGAVAGAVASAGDWQALWSPAHGAYYFYNAVTQETTWTNPLQPASSSSSSPSSASPGPSAAGPPSGSVSAAGLQALYDLQAAAAAQGIDPALAHLDPSLAAGAAAGHAGAGPQTFAAKFNARTGAFTAADARAPEHLGEYERARRMSEFYFDVGAWEREVEMRGLEEAQETESRKRKRPTKKDLERFKQQKKLKKIAKTAWLRT